MEKKGGGKTKSKKKDNTPIQDEPEIVEVTWEAVTRKEAENMKIDPALYMDSGSTLIDESASADLSPGAADTPEAKVKIARRHLRKKEVEEALTIAQEAVWANPNLVSAKIVIARCFILRKQFDKAFAILNAIPEEARTPEVQYYMAVCNSNLGRLPEALALLKQAKAACTDQALAKKIKEYMSHLKGASAVCQVCGQKKPYNDMVEVDGHMVCSDCAAEDDDEDDDDSDEEDERPAARKGRKIRSRHAAESKLLPVLIVLLALVAGLIAFKSYDAVLYKEIVGIFDMIPFVGEYIRDALLMVPDVNGILDLLNPVLSLVGLG